MQNPPPAEVTIRRENDPRRSWTATAFIVAVLDKDTGAIMVDVMGSSSSIDALKGVVDGTIQSHRMTFAVARAVEQMRNEAINEALTHQAMRDMKKTPGGIEVP